MYKRQAQGAESAKEANSDSSSDSDGNSNITRAQGGIDISIPKGQTTKGYNSLSWEARDELAGKLAVEYYVIEKRNAIGDFVEIAKLLSKGTVTGVATYIYEDHNVEAELQEYQVRVVTKDGKTELLGAVVLEDVVTVEGQVRLYPNITTDIANLRIAVEAPTTIKAMVLTMTGEVINATLIDDELLYGLSLIHI